MNDRVKLSFEYPAKVAAMLLNNEADIGLLPVAVIPQLKESYIISDYCIGAVNEVASVCLFSDVPVEEIETIFLDYQSRTSVGLLRILLQYHWKISPEIISTSSGYETNIIGKAAGLVIGDRAFTQRTRSKYIYDLAAAWIEMTGLPFVFAAWIANKKLPDNFIASFNATTASGLQHIGEIVAKTKFEVYDLYKYYTHNISYELDGKKREGMNLFLSMLSADK